MYYVVNMVEIWIKYSVYLFGFNSTKSKLLWRAAISAWVENSGWI